MRLVTFATAGGQSWGPLIGRSILDITRLRPDLPRDLVGFLAAGEPAAAIVRAAATRPDRDALVPLTQVRLLAPVPQPGKILCLGYNYRGHEAVDDPEYPDVFAKTPNTIIGSGDPIRLPPTTRQPDYEAELAVVIGVRGTRLTERQAVDHIGGYTIFNDVSARDWQGHGSQWLLGKSFDTFGPLGPALVTPDDVPDPSDLPLKLTVNGETTVRSTTAAMIFPIPFLISYISQVMTLEPGDIIATGTPQKLPGALAHQRFIQDGDEIAITIGTLGTLTNPVVATL